MIAALAAFVCSVAIALVDGYVGPRFAPVVLADAARAAAPLLAVALVVALLRRATRLRGYEQALAVVSVAAQAALAFCSFGWWWIEPHATLTSLTGSSEQARWWLAATGVLAGALITALASALRQPGFAAELWVGTATVFLLGGGRVYRAFDQVESGRRALAAIAIAVACGVLGVAAYRGLRGRSSAVRRALFAGCAFAALLAPIATALPAPIATALPVPGATALLAPGVGGGGHGAAALGGADPGASVLLVVIDTLRADAADRDSSSDESALMPQLDRIAAAGTRFTQAIAPAPWTLPSTLSIVSGWNPHRHKAGRSTSSWRVLPGDPAASYLGPTLRDAGYQVASFVHNPYLRPFYGFGGGHLLFRPYHGRAADGSALLLDWLADHGRRPFFAMLHVMDPHWPYEPVEGFGAPRTECVSCDSLKALAYDASGPLVRREVSRRYDAEVSYTDSVLGKLYDSLAGQGLLDNAWLIVTSDHGEEFWDHGGFLHGHQLYDELLHVPLVVVPPASAAGFARGRRVSTQVRLEDVAATVLDVAAADQTLARDGKSLRPLVSASVLAPADAAQRVAICGYVKSPTDLRYAVRMPPFKAVFHQGNIFASVIFDLRTDPGEKATGFPPELQARGPGAVAYALHELDATPARVGIDVHREPVLSHDDAKLDADTERQLRSLGYLQ